MALVARAGAAALLLALLTGCGAAVVPVIPTDPPTATATFTPSPSRTPGAGATPTATTPPPPVTATGGPSPTSLFGPTSTPAPELPTATRVANPNAPRIEYFTSDSAAVAPGSSVNLFWSTRGAAGATIYRLDETGARSQLWNVPPDGSLPIPTRRSDRGEVNFVLRVGDGPLAVEQALTVALACPDPWFFSPAPDACPVEPAAETLLVEAPFERGRMLYIEARDRVYALFNDGRQPAWLSVPNRYNPAVHPELEESFVPPPGLYQPIAVLGFVWRGSDTVRNRLGLALQPETRFVGKIQAAPAGAGAETLYASSADGMVLQLLPGGESWQIITPP